MLGLNFHIICHTMIFHFEKHFFTFQIEIHEAPAHLGITDEMNCEILELLTGMLSTQWDGVHTCQQTSEEEEPPCLTCEITALWHEVAVKVCQNVSMSNVTFSVIC